MIITLELRRAFLCLEIRACLDSKALNVQITVQLRASTADDQSTADSLTGRRTLNRSGLVRGTLLELPLETLPLQGTNDHRHSLV